MPSQMIDPTENNQSEKEAEAKAYAQGKRSEERRVGKELTKKHYKLTKMQP